MDREKFKETLLYVAARLARLPSYGSIKLNKVLFFSDVLHYATYGKSITGATYVRHKFGPAPRGLRQIQQEMIDADEADLAVTVSPDEHRSNRLLFATREADITKFTGSEIEVIGRVINMVKDHTAEEASDLSHALEGWQIAAQGEVIPYEAIFLYRTPLTREDEARADSLVEELRGELERAGVHLEPVA
jgi:hypothetical protein